MIMQRFSLGYECPREEPAFTGLNEAYFGHNGSGDWWLYSEPRVNPIADNSMIGMHDRTRVQSWARHEEPAPITSYNAVKVLQPGGMFATTTSPITTTRSPLTRTDDQRVVYNSTSCTETRPRELAAHERGKPLPGYGPQH